MMTTECHGHQGRYVSGDVSLAADFHEMPFRGYPNSSQNAHATGWKP